MRTKIGMILLVGIVVMMSILSLCFVACGEKPVDPDVVEPQQGNNNSDPGEQTVIPEGKTLIHVEGSEYTKLVAVGEYLKVDPVGKTHYDFVRYKLVAPDGNVYYSDDNGQQWQKGEEGMQMPLKWPYENREMTIVPEFEPKTYRVYFAANEDAIRTKDASLMRFFRNVTFGDDWSKLRDALQDLSNEMIDEVERMHSDDEKVFDLQPAAWVCFDTVRSGAAVELTDNAFQFFVDYQTLNERFYFDEENDACYIGVKWAPKSHVVNYYVRNTTGSNWNLGGTSDPVILNGRVQLSTTAATTPNGTAIIGWTATRYFETDYSATDASKVDYQLGAWYELTQPANADLYAVYVTLPRTPTVEVIGLKLVASDITDADGTVIYSYATKDDLSHFETFSGNIGSLAVLSEPYCARVQCVKTYNGLDVIGAPADVWVMRNPIVPQVTIASDALSVSLSGNTVDNRNVLIQVDDTPICTLSDMAEDFLCWLPSGDHSIKAYVSVESVTVDEDTGLEQKTVTQTGWSVANTFNVRSMAHEWNKPDTNNINFKLADGNKVDGSYNAEGTMTYHNVNSDTGALSEAVYTSKMSAINANGYEQFAARLSFKVNGQSKQAKLALLRLTLKGNGSNIVSKKVVLYYSKDSSECGVYDEATGRYSKETSFNN